MEKINIRECPACGSTNVIVTDDIEYALGGYFCKCKNCGEVQKENYTSSKGAIEAWNDRDECMTGNKYQHLASRTMASDWSKRKEDFELHALHGMVGEIGELHSIYQKEYQGHDIRHEKEHMQKELGDLLWFIAEYCTIKGWKLEDIMDMNIKKLRARYPDGFEAEKSLNRKDGDI